MRGLARHLLSLRHILRRDLIRFFGDWASNWNEICPRHVVLRLLYQVQRMCQWYHFVFSYVYSVFELGHKATALLYQNFVAV